MVFPAAEQSLSGFSGGPPDIRRMNHHDDLRDYQMIKEEVIGEGCESEIERYRHTLANHPGNMSIYIAYVDGEPAACGRIHFHPDSKFGALYGGQTRERYRNQGLYTQLVAARIREAISRGIVNICIDALPTSEPILKKRGFQVVTWTQPYCLPR